MGWSAYAETQTAAQRKSSPPTSPLVRGSRRDGRRAHIETFVTGISPTPSIGGKRNVSAMTVESTWKIVARSISGSRCLPGGRSGSSLTPSEPIRRESDSFDMSTSAQPPTRSDEIEPLTKIVIPGNRGVKLVRAVTIRKPAAELYAFWRDVENLVQVIPSSAAINTLSHTESRWVVTGPGGTTVTWDAIVINDHPGSLIAWRSRDGADVPNAGSVRFEPAPGDEGTEVTVALEYDPPGGKLAAFFAKLSGKEGGQQVDRTLKRFKALMEAGEIPTIEGQSVGGPQGPRKGEK